jgi:WD40 repeat protein
MAVGSQDGTIRLLDAQTLRDQGARMSHPGPVNGLAFTPDARRLVSWGGDGDGPGIAVWDVGARRMDGAPFGQAGLGEGGLLADGVTLLLVPREPGGHAAAWSVEARTPSTAYEVPSAEVDGLAVTPDGRLVALGTDDGTVVIEPRKGTVTDIPGARHPSSLSPDGQTLLAVRGEDIEVWRVASGVRRDQARGHSANVLATAWSPNGRSFASVGADGLVLVWDGDDARPRHEFRGPGGPARLVSFTADGRGLVTVGRDGRAVLWDLTGTRGVGARAENGDVRALACAVAGRDMTTEEWRRYLPDTPYRHVCPN